jgi:phosphoribosylformylglycinamidine synthase
VTTAPEASARQHVPDSVSNAEATPEKEQPYGALGLKDDEYARIREILGRRPTSGELAMYSVGALLLQELEELPQEVRPEGLR